MTIDEKLQHPNGTRIRLVWPTVARTPFLAGLGKMLTRTIILAPLAWIVMAIPYFSKVLLFVGVRYELTNTKLMIQRGWKYSIRQAIALGDIDDVEIDPESIDQFFRSADLRIISDGKVEMTLIAVPDAAAFRHTILATRDAFAPGKVKLLPFIPASATK